jgi:hypothetical protein
MYLLQIVHTLFLQKIGVKIPQFLSKFVNLKRKQILLLNAYMLRKLLNVSTVRWLRFIDNNGENKSRL